MMLYGISSFLFYQACKYKNKLVLLISLSFPLIFATFREGIGTDYNTYLIMYEYNSTLSLTQFFLNRDFSSVSVFLFSKISYLFGTSKIFFFLFAFTTLVPFSIFIYKKINYKKSFAIYFVFLLTTFTVSLNIMKQAAAVSIVFISFYFILKNNFLLYLLSILCASLFHSSAIIMLPIYFLWDHKKGNIRYTIVIPLLLFIFIFSLQWRSILPFLVKIFPFLDRYLGYADSTVSSKNMSFFIDVFFLLIFIVFYKRLRRKKENKLYLLLLLIGILFEIMGFSMVYAKRLSIYFISIPTIFLSMETCNLFKEKKITFFLFVAYEVTYFYISVVLLGHGDLI